MKLALSTAASPFLARDALASFDEACRGRGLDGVEIVLGRDDDPDSLSEHARAAGIRVVALRAALLDDRSAPALARASARLDAPVSVPGDAVPHESLTTLARVFAEEGGRLLLAHGSDLDEVVELVGAAFATGAPPALGLAWELRPSSEDLAERGAILMVVREHLQLVRLYGGGPEQSDQDGRGLGPLLVDLAMSAYAGPIVLHPSTREELPRWSRWLASRKSAGCGHGHDAREINVDVRDVEPKDRLDTILGAYRALARGATLKLTVDHDPSCMYYTLQATEPEGTFTFRTVDHGPEVWRAEVDKL